VIAGLALSACGSSGPPQSAGEPSANFPVEVSTASFPASQTLAEHTQLVISVRNAGSKAIPNIAVTITNPRYGTAAQAFGVLLPANGSGQPLLAGRSRAVWVVDQAPGPCGYSCKQGGAGGAATAYSNTWALGRLAPGATARFDWHLTAVQPGTYTVAYRVAAGLAGKARAVLAGGGPVAGSFKVRIAHPPRQAYVNNSGQIVYTK
jgi:hypothetical protein